MDKRIHKILISMFLCFGVLFLNNHSVQANLFKGLRAMAEQWSGLRKLINSEAVHQTGKGITIGVIDSGIDSTHSKLRGKVLENRGYSAVFGSLYGHGTQVAGIISELAPQAKLIDYRVIDSEGEAHNADVLGALKQAIHDQVQIINLSLSMNNLDDNQMNSLEKIIREATLKGIVVVASAGNSGEWGRGSVCVPASFPLVMAVGASTPLIELPVAEVVGSSHPIILNPKTSIPEEMFGKTYPIVNLGQGVSGDLKQNMRGKVVVLQEGNVPGYYDLLKRAKREQAVAVLTFDKKVPLVFGQDNHVHDLFKAEISEKDGIFLQNHLQGERAVRFVPGNRSRSVITQMSSWGSGLDGGIKPDLVAPGYAIVAPHPDESYTQNTGTSYAAPMVTGGVALVKEAHPEWSVGEILSSLCANATPIEDVFSGKSYPPDIQGGGQLNVQQAITAETFLFPNRVRFQLSTKNPELQKEIIIRNTSKQTKKYLFHLEEAEMKECTLSIPKSVTVSPGAQETVVLHARMETTTDGMHHHAGRLFVTDEQQTMNVPFTIDLDK